MTSPGSPRVAWALRTRVLSADRPLIMGILNVTPDSFSDGGLWTDAGAAVAHGRRLMDAGADLVDVGGESTRPGASAVPEVEELARILPIVRELAAEGIPVSVDTAKPSVAEEALEAGAEIINDVTGLRSEAMRSVIASAGAGTVVMHMQGEPRTMQAEPRYDDVVGEVEAFLLDQAAIATASGIEPSKIAIDPGIGFGKTVEHNLLLLRATPRLSTHGFPVLVGHSRKRFLGELTGIADATDRDGATAALSGILAGLGVSVLRVHDPRATQDALFMASAMVQPYA